MSIEIVRQAMELQANTVDQWHHESIQIETAVQQFLGRQETRSTCSQTLLSQTGWLETVCQQHSYNFQLWHQEDIARSPVVSDAEIATVKRAIDGYNQKRNDWIEKVDDYLTAFLEQQGVVADAQARLNTETPGSALDRLSIMSLRLYHLREQLDRDDIDQDHRSKVEQKIHICRIQQHDLGQSLADLLDDIVAGHKRHRTYRQCKMYNDPSLNPEVYNARRAA